MERISESPQTTSDIQTRKRLPPLPSIIEVVENRQYWEDFLHHLQTILSHKDDGIPTRNFPPTVDRDHGERVDWLYEARNELKRLEAWSLSPTECIKRKFNVTWDCSPGSIPPPVDDMGNVLSGKTKKRIRNRAYQQQLDNVVFLDRLAKDPQILKRLRAEISDMEATYTGYVPKPSPVPALEVGNSDWPPSQSEFSSSKTRQAEQKLNDILWATLDRLAGNSISSGITLIFCEMFELIDELFTSEEKEMIRPQLFRISDELKREHNWTGTDFYCEPNSVHLRDTLTKLISSSSQS
jgi:hypothetical protein